MPVFPKRRASRGLVRPMFRLGTRRGGPRKKVPMLSRITSLAIALVAVSALALGSQQDTDAAPSPDNGPQYLALGDSLAFGIGASGAANGYVPQVHHFLRDALDPGKADPPSLDSVPDAFNERFLGIVNLGVGGPGAPPGGETTGTMISGGQLAAAVAELEERNGNSRGVDDVRVVTLDIGGDDMFPLLQICAGGFTPDCVQAITATFGTFSANYGYILGQLRAAGPDTPIAVMTYYNSLVNPGCPFSPLAGAADAVLEGNAALGLPVRLNDIIRATASAFGADVAETFGELGAGDLQPDCRHPNDSGHEKIAAAFVEALEE